MEKTKTREYWIDWAKMLLIYLMIVAHSGRISTVADVLICSFHMPAFFFISGYLHKMNPNILNGIKADFKRLIVPTLFFYVVCYCFWLAERLLRGDFADLSYNDLMVKPLLGLFIYDRTIATPMCLVTWFLITLFFAKFLCNFLLRYPTSVVIVFLVIDVIILSTINEGNFRLLYFPQREGVAFPFFIVGYYCKKHGWFNSLSNLSQKHVYNIGLFIVLLVLFISLALYNERVGIHSFHFGKSIFLFYPIAFLGVLVIYLFSRCLGSFVFNRFILTISSGTIVILGFHRLFLRGFGTLFDKFSIPVEGFILSFVILLFCYPTILLCNRYIPFWIESKK